MYSTSAQHLEVVTMNGIMRLQNNLKTTTTGLSMKTKSCSTCKHYRRSWLATLLLFTNKNDKCMRPIKYLFHQEEPYRFAEMERSEEWSGPEFEHLNPCGPEGKYHEPK